MDVRRRLGLATLAALIAVSLTALSCGRTRDECPLCQRGECANLAFTIERTNGAAVRTCCPRCGLHALRPAGSGAGSGAASVRWDDVRSLSVADFDTAQSLRAESALYVEGSDVTPCSMHVQAPRDERGCCLAPVYDRCLPSVLAFRTRERAEAFAKDNGGIVRSFEELKAASAAAPSPAS